MIVQEPHPFFVSVNPGDAAPECGYQVVHRGEQHLGQHGSFQMPPQSFDQVQARAVGRQPEDFEAMSMGFQPRVNRFRVMEASVVADQPDLPTRVGRDQCDQEDKDSARNIGRNHQNRGVNLAQLLTNNVTNNKISNNEKNGHEPVR